MNMHRPHCVLLYGILIGAAGMAAAQEQPLPVQPVVPVPALKPLNILLNTPVFLAAPKTEDAGDQQAGQRDNAGLLSNLVIDTMTHRITFAVVNTEDVTRAVPFLTLTWDAGSGGWMLAGGKEVLAQAKPFEAWRIDELHGNVAEVSVDKTIGQERQVEDAERRTADAGKAPPTHSNRYLLATECAKREVAAEDGSFAAGVGLVIETNSGSPAFLRVAAAGGDVAIPFAALKARKTVTSNEQECFSVAMTKAKLESAPRLDKDPKNNLDDRDFRVQLYEFFGVVTPPFDNSNSALRKN